MRRALVFVFVLLASAVSAGPLDEFAWTNRVLIIFADSELDPVFLSQMAMLESDLTPLEHRDIVVLADLGPESALRSQLRPLGFSVVLIDKDGSIILRRPAPMSVRELARHIDKTPLRIDELAAGAPR